MSKRKRSKGTRQEIWLHLTFPNSKTSCQSNPFPASASGSFLSAQWFWCVEKRRWRGGVPEIRAISPSCFSLGPRTGQLARAPGCPAVTAPPAEGGGHLRVNSYVVNVELFTVLKLLWAMRGEQSRKAVSQQETGCGHGGLRARRAGRAWKPLPVHTAASTLPISSLGVPALLPETARPPGPRQVGSALTL